MSTRLWKRGSAALVAVAALAVAIVAVLPGGGLHFAQAIPTSCSGGSFTGQTFTATFDGTPSAPLDCALAGWEIVKHQRDEMAIEVPTPMEAQHGPMCESPEHNGSMTHHISTWDQTVFQCNGHIMTAINTDLAVGIIGLTPPALADTSAGEAVIRFDLSTLRTSNRDWVNIFLTPVGAAMPLPQHRDGPTGGPVEGIQILQFNMGPTANLTGWGGYVTHGGIDTNITNGAATPQESLVAPSAVNRSTFELRLSRTHLSFGLPAAGYRWIDREIPDLGGSLWSVQFQHASYNPDKACADNGTCSPNTWHWDNVTIAPARPVTITPLGLHKAIAGTSYPLPVGSGRTLRYSAHAANLDASFDGGATWVPAGFVSTTAGVGAESTASAVKNYALAVPDGASTVRWRGQGVWFSQPATIMDAHTWATGTASTPTPTPTPSLTPTPTPTPTPAPVCRMAIYVGAQPAPVPGAVVACP